MKIKNKFSISIVGAGRLGGALAIALARKNYKIVSVVARRFETAARAAQQISTPPEILTAENIAEIPSSDIVFITTPDPEIEPTAARLAANRNFNSETIFLHTSGSLSSAVLSKLKNVGANTGSLHPLVSVSDSGAGAERFAGAFFCVEGDATAVAAAKFVVQRAPQFQICARRPTRFCNFFGQAQSPMRRRVCPRRRLKLKICF